MISYIIFSVLFGLFSALDFGGYIINYINASRKFSRETFLRRPSNRYDPLKVSDCVRIRFIIFTIFLVAMPIFIVILLIGGRDKIYNILEGLFCDFY